MKKVSSHEVGRLESHAEAALDRISEVRDAVANAFDAYYVAVEEILLDGLDAVDPDKNGVRVSGQESPGC